MAVVLAQGGALHMLESSTGVKDLDVWTLPGLGFPSMDRRDGRSLASILRADSRWVIPGRGRLCGTYVGPEQIFDMWRKTAEYTGGGLTLSLIDVLANDERAVALVRVRGQRGERTVDARQFALFEISGSTVTEARFVYEDQNAYEDFWS